MEDVKTLRKWFQKGSMCMGLDLKDAFLYVPMSARVKKFLRFKWMGKLFECSPRTLTYMVAPIVKYLCSRGISLMTFMDNFTNQA